MTSAMMTGTRADGRAAGLADDGPEVEPRTVEAWVRAGQAVVVDVREPDEHGAERIAGARLMPLSRLDAAAAAAIPCQRLVLHCKGGKRSMDALRLMNAAGLGASARSMAGGIGAWKAAGLATVKGSGPRVSVMRQVQLVVGLTVLASGVLGVLVDARLALVGAAMGLGLTIAGATGTCLLASVLAKMPWNRVSDAGGACGGGGASCSVDSGRA
jgi:rhodanese-related sulfurtransferase